MKENDENATGVGGLALDLQAEIHICCHYLKPVKKSRVRSWLKNCSELCLWWSVQSICSRTAFGLCLSMGGTGGAGSRVLLSLTMKVASFYPRIHR